MQPRFGSNPGRERGFAGDCAANSGLVGRIVRLEMQRAPPHASRGGDKYKHHTAPHHTSKGSAAEYRRRVPPTSRAQIQPSRYTENKVLFSVPCVCARESFFWGRSGRSGSRQWRKPMGQPNEPHDAALTGRREIAGYRRKTRVQSPPSRYTENKVLFSVPCVCARESFFWGFLSVPGHSHSLTGAGEQDTMVPPNGSRVSTS